MMEGGCLPAVFKSPHLCAVGRVKVGARRLGVWSDSILQKILFSKCALGWEV